MSDEAQTKPTLETISKQIEALRVEMRDGFSAVNHMLEQMDIRFDRVEGVAYGAHAIALNLRADFKEFHSQSKEAA